MDDPFLDHQQQQKKKNCNFDVNDVMMIVSELVVVID